MLLFQAGTFLFPYKIWKVMEGGLIAAFGDDARLVLESWELN
jgi:predicted ATPase